MSKLKPNESNNLFIALNKAHLSKAKFLSNSSSQIFYISNTSLDKSNSGNIHHLNNLDELMNINLKGIKKCFIFSMQPHYALIKFLIRIRDEKILIIHLEEAHQLAMHNFRVNTFQLLPDLILLASDLEKEKYNYFFPNNNPVFLEPCWPYRIESKKIIDVNKIDSESIVVSFAAPKRVTLLTDETYQSRLILIKKIYEIYPNKKLLLSLHPAENKANFKKFLSKEGIYPDILDKKDPRKSLKINSSLSICSAKSQTSIDLITQNKYFLIYNIGPKNFISNHFKNSCIMEDDNFGIYEIVPNTPVHSEFIKKYLPNNPPSFSILSNHLNFYNLTNNDAHNTNQLIIEYLDNRKLFFQKYCQSKNIDLIARNLFSREYQNLSSDQSYLLIKICFENINYFSKSIYDLRKLNDQLELPNAFFDPITYLKAHNYLIYFLKYGESKINFKKLYALQYSYCEEHLSIYIINKIQSLSSSSPLVIRFLAYKIIDLIYSVIKKLKTSSV